MSPLRAAGMPPINTLPDDPIVIDDPDDDLLTALILKLFTDRQITPPLSLASYLARRIERSFAAAAQIVADLDTIAMRDGKPINQRMAAALLDN